VNRSVVALLAIIAAVLSACGDTPASSLVERSAANAGSRHAPAGLSIKPNIADSGCNGGHGGKFATHGWKESVDAVGTLADGSTLAAFSQIYPGKNYAILDSVTSRCVRNRTFGDAGVATVRIPRRLVPHPGEPYSNYLWVNAVSARRGGGAILAGTYRGRWVVGAVTSRGHLNPRFGTHGWTILPLRGEATAILQVPSGRILLGGDNDGGGCCTINHAVALSPDGHLDRTFGNHGRVKLPTGEDSGVESLAREPNGDILAEVAYGNMGCFGVALAMLKPHGNPVPHFSNRLKQFWRRFHFGAFVGDTYVDHGGFTLVGTGQQSCDGGPKSGAHPKGLIVGFRTDGTAARSTARFPSKLLGGVNAFKDGPDTLMAVTPYADSTRLTLRLLRPNGSAKRSFGTNGRVRIHTPWRGHIAAIETSIFLGRASAKTLNVAATEGERKQLQETRLRL
jgi:hypothetical protein